MLKSDKYDETLEKIFLKKNGKGTETGLKIYSITEKYANFTLKLSVPKSIYAHY